jgi:hypothetical protein
VRIRRRVAIRPRIAKPAPTRKAEAKPSVRVVGSVEVPISELAIAARMALFSKRADLERPACEAPEGS